MGKELFASGIEELKYQEFTADGFAKPVCGIIYRAGQSSCGAPVGGIGTGCMDIDTNGAIGRSSIFNSFAPPRDLNTPFLALAVGDKVQALAKKDVAGATAAKDVRYFGHYPVVDMEFDLDGPVSAGVRAWSPFVPGDSALSDTPGVVCEVRLRNTTSAMVSGAVVFTFPGPSNEESGATSYARKNLNGSLGGVEVTGETDLRVGFALGAIGESKVRAGAALSADNGDWGKVAKQLPAATAEAAGASVAVDFSLGANEARTVRFVLAWYHPRWVACDWRWYLQAYTARFASAGEVADMLAREHASILKRILAWQEVIYAEKQYPVWLREQLVNVMYTITEDALWACDQVPSADWAKPLGIFGLIESPRSVPHVAIPSDWYGGLPFVYFFPDLQTALLRGYVHYQLPTGEIPLGLGWFVDLGTPLYDILRTTNSSNFVDLVHRLWLRDKDEAVLREFYPAAKKAMEFNLTLDRDCDGLLDCDPWPCANQFYGDWHWEGAATHCNGYWLAALKMTERMAEAFGDTAFAHVCRTWFDRGAKSLEEKLWNGEYYLLWHDTATGKKCDTILSNQLSGQYLAGLHGLGDVFPKSRVKATLETMKKRVVGLSKYGVRNAIKPDGTVDHDGKLQSTGIFTGETICLAATFAYAGDKKAAEECAFKLMDNLIFGQHVEWDLPNNVDPETGKVTYGTDFYQFMVQWALPPALSGQSIDEFCASGGLVDRIMRAAKA
ncbi:MAG: GH116 family glycosyl hydrolase [Armatimonadetes bacterium]|nr:GH116 family glycosyl hydrolase [Armatimonadota bacterium]